ncbi:hypothetical protein VTJ83DRAFT_185 [Remersonia thermophila]|uniref:Uncharacterized protein n=1 Tax=Remersonia thermophila TaxID=72144 RepID=A0ABR4DLA9_9PEZI
MAPIRRYLRITKYSVLECRIYLDNPALASSWLLNPRDPVLPRVIEAVRPLVLPKLREEQERERSKKKSKKRSIKDVVVQDDFEVAIFLTETDTRHSLLHKTKILRDKVQTRLTSNSSRLVGASRESPVDVDAADLVAADDDVPVLRVEEDDDGVNLGDIPLAGEQEPARRRSKRRPRLRGQREQGDDEGGDVGALATGSSSSASSPSSSVEFLGDDGEHSEDSDDSPAGSRPPKRRREHGPAGAQGQDAAAAAAATTTSGGTAGERDDKKKMAFDVSYEGFAIYGRVLCLVVKRRGAAGMASGLAGGPHGTAGAAQASRPGGQATMENWIASTQMPADAAGQDDDEGDEEDGSGP